MFQTGALRGPSALPRRISVGRRSYRCRSALCGRRRSAPGGRSGRQGARAMRKGAVPGRNPALDRVHRRIGGYRAVPHGPRAVRPPTITPGETCSRRPAARSGKRAEALGYDVSLVKTPSRSLGYAFSPLQRAHRVAQALQACSSQHVRWPRGDLFLAVMVAASRVRGPDGNASFPPRTAPSCSDRGKPYHEGQRAMGSGRPWQP
jgi:hypothetical protein